MSNAVHAFLAELEHLLKSGQATEHSYRPALQTLFDALLAPARAVNEPRRAEYGAPDFVFVQGQATLGHAEAKDVGVELAGAIVDSERGSPRTREGKQLRRYREALPNLLYTDGLVWHWFVSGEARLAGPVRLATWDRAKKALKVSAAAEAELRALLTQVAAQQVPTVSRPKELAERLARLARWLREVIAQVFEAQDEEGELHQQLEAFKQTLLPTLTPDEFAEMYAQTIVYGLFTARVTLPDKPDFSRFDAALAIPESNPFLRKLFQSVAGYELDERIAWLVDDCAHLLARTDMGEVLRDFGKATRQGDPVVHFYETFLAAYDSRLREARGVYYTPEPVVSYIVRSVDRVLRDYFDKPMGLADEKAIVLDPATGTATFLHAVVQEIHATLAEREMLGAWQSYVREKLLPRLFGFELLMAPYTVAHLKLGLLLSELKYKFGKNERLGVYLTNALSDLPKAQQALAFAQYIAAEARAANTVKRDQPVMVVIGNPPYSGHSANAGEWIDELLHGEALEVAGNKLKKIKVESYYEVDGQPLGERNPKWLQDDYVKFIRFGQWRIDRTGEGVLAFISNNGYLDNPTFRGMRQSLMAGFDEIYILNLHGNSKKKERTPEGKPDKNVFDIQQGVAIGIFIKYGETHGPARVCYADLWGEREAKYEVLAEHTIASTPWQELSPVSPWYLFVPQDVSLLEEYEGGWKITEIWETNSVGIVTGQDSETIAMTHPEAVGLAEAHQLSQSAVVPLAHRPFDDRFVVYDTRAVTRMRYDVMRHMMIENLGFAMPRRVETFGEWQHIFVSQNTIEHVLVSGKTIDYLFPLYLYPSPVDQIHQTTLLDIPGTGPGGRRANLSETFIAEVEQRLGLRFVPDGRGDVAPPPTSGEGWPKAGERATVGPEDIFHYAYALFHAPSYRERYAECLKIDFPRLPLTSDRELFAALALLGAQLVDLHLLRLPGQNGVGGAGGAQALLNPAASGLAFPIAGSNEVERPRYVPPTEDNPGRVYLNQTQYFSGIGPDTWEATIGGYQPLEKWLKDRRGRLLSFDEVQHYLRMVVALRETCRLMAEIDASIPGWPLP